MTPGFKKPGFLKKAQPSGVFWFYWVYWVFAQAGKNR